MTHNSKIDPTQPESVQRLASFEGQTVTDITFNEDVGVVLTFEGGRQLTIVHGRYSGLEVHAPVPRKVYTVTFELTDGGPIAKEFDSKDEADKYMSHLDAKEIVHTLTETEM